MSGTLRISTLADGSRISVSHDEGTDGLGTPFATVSVTDGPTGSFTVTHSSFRRGGCLYAGFAMLRNTKTGASREVDITSWASDTDDHAVYLLSLAAKHVGAAV